jgi:acyl carrier protein
MDIIAELKNLMLKVGVEESVVSELTPYLPLAGHVMDSMGYTAFIVAVEERFGVTIADDPDKPFIRSLNDFKKLIEEKD